MKTVKVLLLDAIASALVASACAATPVPPDVQGHIDRAKAAAGSEYGNIVPGLCPNQGPPAMVREIPEQRETWYRPPTKVFDNLYYVGQKGVSVWAIKTSAGLILIDSAYPYSVEPEVIQGLTTLGLDPSTIRYVIVTHGHLDHFGGAKYLQDRGAKIVMSAADWDYMLAGNGGNGPRPHRDVVVTQRQKLTLGDTSVDMVPTPGHTPGTISLIFPVKDGKQTHVAGLWGGTGLGARQDIAAFTQYETSARMFMEATKQAHVDVPLSNHPIVGNMFGKMERLKTRKAGEPNPFVTGWQSERNLLTFAAECAEAQRLLKSS